MEIHPIAKMITEMGANPDLSMFPELQQKEIYSQVADIFMRHQKYDKAIEFMEKAGRPLPIEQIKKVAESKMLLGKHEEAYALLMKCGDPEIAEFIKQNFLNK